MIISKKRWDFMQKRLQELEQRVAMLELGTGPSITSTFTAGHHEPIQTRTYYLPDPEQKAPVWYMEGGEIRNVD